MTQEQINADLFNQVKELQDIKRRHEAEVLTMAQENDQLRSEIGKAAARVTDTVEPAVLHVPVGDAEQTFSIGDLLNAVDYVVCCFQSMREQTDAEIAGALRLYADKLDADNKEI